MEKKKATDGHAASTPPLSDGHAVAPASQPVSAVTLPELRAMARLCRKADQQVAQLGLADSSASTSDSDGDDSDLQSPLSTKAKIAHAHGGKSLKSGKEAKITSTVLYPQSWSHCYLSITQGRRDVKYEELKLEEFVAGYGQILLSPDLSEVERSSRLKHLVSLMYFSQLYECQNVLGFHGAVLLEIEHGLLQFAPSFSAFNIAKWRELLQHYPDNVICDFLEFGWPIGYMSDTLPIFYFRTHRGALTFPDQVNT